MNLRWLVVVAAGLALIGADAAQARSRHKPRHYCYDRPAHISLWGIFANPAPQPNGCAPPVFAYGRYVGQDPDSFIRQQLNRDPVSGYGSEFAR